MKKYLLFTALLTAVVAVQAQVGIKTNTPNPDSDLELASTNKTLLLNRVDDVESTILNPVNGMLVYDTSKECFNGFENGAWKCLGVAPDPSIAANCDQNGFTGNFKKNTALSGNTFSVTITNNSFYTAEIGFATTDLVLSGISGITVASVSPTSASLIAGGSKTISYTLSGTPTACGDLTATWTKLSLNCTKTVKVAPAPSFDCAAGSWTTPVAPDYRLDGLRSGTSYTGVYNLPYTNGECTYQEETITQNGLTLKLVAGSYAGSGNLQYTLSGTYTGIDRGSVTFVTASGCSIYLGLCQTCKEIKDKGLASTDGQYWLDIDRSATTYGPMRAYCDMTTNGGGWTLLSVNGLSFGAYGYVVPEKTEMISPTISGYLPRSMVISIAKNSTQVQLRSGNSSTSYAHKVTSQNGGPAIMALRDTSTTTNGNGTWHRAGAFEDFMNNPSIPPVGSWIWTNATCAPTVAGWPFMAHICGNSNGVHWLIQYNSNRTAYTDPWASTWVR